MCHIKTHPNRLSDIRFKAKLFEDWTLLARFRPIVEMTLMSFFKKRHWKLKGSRRLRAALWPHYCERFWSFTWGHECVLSTVMDGEGFCVERTAVFALHVRHRKRFCSSNQSVDMPFNSNAQWMLLLQQSSASHSDEECRRTECWARCVTF